MIIDFNNEKAKQIPNFKGGENIFNAKIFYDDNNKILYGSLEKGASIGYHTHETNSEIIYILKGEGKLIYDGESETASKGMCHYCPKGHSHSLCNESDELLEFFAVVPEH